MVMGRLHFILLLWLISFVGRTITEDRGDYLKQRNRVINEEWEQRTGSFLVLNKAEQKVDVWLMKQKNEEITQGRKPGAVFPPAVHFFKAKPYIDNSTVFHFIKSLPKGAVLHVHDMSMVSLGWVIENVTYQDNCYMCVESTGQLQFHFFQKPPSNPGCEWVLVNQLRIKTGNSTYFDELLYRNLSLVVDNPDVAYPTQHAVWQKFYSTFTAIQGLLFYAPVFKAYYRQALQEFYDDNVQYVEMRALLPEVYELDGSTHDRSWVVGMYGQVAQQFVTDNPDFIGAKTIYTSIRLLNQTVIGAAVKEAVSLRHKYPDHMAGYDLVGQEDPGNPLVYYLDELLYPSQQLPPEDLPYFFHAGETDWEDTDVDQNLIDALLLNTSRIGHGFAITKHPLVMKMARERGVPVEVNPISNQVLKLVDDLRDHPAATLLSTGFPVVICCDDPSVWGAKGLSYDFYEVFMGIGGARANLATLKQLAMDSIRYSAISRDKMSGAYKLWEHKWDTFIQQTSLKYKL